MIKLETKEEILRMAQEDQFFAQYKFPQLGYYGGTKVVFKGSKEALEKIADETLTDLEKKMDAFYKYYKKANGWGYVFGYLIFVLAVLFLLVCSILLVVG